MSELLKIIVIVGPTGSGKSSLGLELAREFDGEIVSADSRTIYKQMNIGTAKPPQDTKGEHLHGSIKEMFAQRPYMVEGIAHWGFDLVNPDERYDVSTYAKFARAKITDIVKRGKLPIIVGGSGLYVQAILDNPTFSETKPNLELRAQLNALGVKELQEWLKEIDFEAYETIDIQNPRRLVRAIEVIKTSGKPWSAQQQKGKPYVDALQIGIEIDREQLYERLDARVDKMVAEGLVNEVRALKEQYGNEAPGMSGIGYRQILGFLNGKESLREAILGLKQDTRQYAKRQLTWFKRDARIVWIQDLSSVRGIIESFLE
jgi:tRNA dimethylallyltransferase